VFYNKVKSHRLSEEQQRLIDKLYEEEGDNEGAGVHPHNKHRHI